MAAKDSDSGVIKKQELDDMTTCCICTEVFTDPKALPCIHTFCMKCIQSTGLETNKGPGDEMPCPICRRMFKIPRDGFHELPKNFFIERLIQMANVSDSSQALRALCDACLEDENEATVKEIPSAVKYCVDCKNKLCEECCSEHRTFKLTKNHKLVPFNDLEGVQNVVTDPLPSVCQFHEQNVLDIYCADCKTVVCATCFNDEHKLHEGSHVNKFIDDFWNQIESDAVAINECKSKAETTKAEILKAKECVQKMVKNLECDVQKRKDELKQFADKHSTSLLQGLYSIRQIKLKEIQLATVDIDTYLSSIETYNSYCQNIMVKGSASHICRSFSDLSVRAVELQQQCQPIIEREIQSFNFCFRKSELEQFIEESCDNMLGKFEEFDSKPKKRSKERLVSEQSTEIDILKTEIEIERTEKESLRLSNDQLRISINKAVQANKALNEELVKEKANNDTLTEKLKQELNKNKTGSSRPTLQANNEKLKQELDARNITNNLLQTNIEQLKKELNNEKIAKNSLQTDKDKLKQDMDKEKLTNNSVHVSYRKLVQEVNMYETTIRTLEDKVEKLGQELKSTKADKLRYIPDPILVQTIKTKAAEEGDKPVVGLTILDKELFVVSQLCSEVEVYDSINFSYSRRWNLKELIRPEDIASCNINKCLYIFDFKEYGQSKEILRVDRNGNLIKKWSTGDNNGDGLSVTDEENVILTVCKENKLNEYSPDGQLARKVILSSNAGFRHPRHAIKLSNGHFMVSHGFNDGDMHRVCVVDADANLKKSFGGKWGSTIGQMNVPVYLSVDRNGFVMVADLENSRVLLLDPDLEFRREIVSKEEKHGLRNPFKILLDESNTRLFVADNGWDSEEKIYTDGRILIFNL